MTARAACKRGNKARVTHSDEDEGDDVRTSWVASGSRALGEGNIADRIGMINQDRSNVVKRAAAMSLLMMGVFGRRVVAGKSN